MIPSSPDMRSRRSRLCAFALLLPICLGAALQDGDVEDPEIAAQASGKPEEGEELAMSPEETERLRALYEAADASTQAELMAYYKDLLGKEKAEDLLDVPAEAAKELERTQKIVEQLGAPLSRPASEVLSERAKLVLDDALPRAEKLEAAEVASWLRARATAGDWSNIAIVLGQLPRAPAQTITSALLRALAGAEDGSQLLPEEVLDVALLLRDVPTRENTAQLATMLRFAAKRHGVASLLEDLRRGKGSFGPGDEASRRRTVELLVGADLVREAEEFLPPLEAARESGDAEILLAHASFLEARADAMAKGPDADGNRRRAFGLVREVSMSQSATPETLRHSIERGANLMWRLPRTLVDPWLESLFSDRARTQVAANVFALKIARKEGEQRTSEDWSKVVLSLSQAVEAMLKAADGQELRVPLRVLASAVCEDIEAAAEKYDSVSYREYGGFGFYESGGSSPLELRALFQAAPSAAWRTAIDRSVATRSSRATIAAAIRLGEMDHAVASLREGIERSPDDGRILAEHFLTTWRASLTGERAQKAATRGDQMRRLDALRRVIDILQGIGIEAKELEPTAQVFAACNHESEIYRRRDIELVYGALKSIPPLTSCMLAESMRVRILEYWDSRVRAPARKAPNIPTQELERVVADGYDTAQDLVESAAAALPGLWRADALRASLAYDRLQLGKRLGRVDQGEELKRTSEAYAAFEQAAVSYANALMRNEQVESADVYSRWFRAAMGASDVSALRAETLPAENSLGDSQFDRIRNAIQLLPADVAYRHTESFAAEILDELDSTPPDAKPRMVRSALRVVADHFAGVPLRQLATLYEELAADEVKLRVAIDGADRVEAGKPFLVLLAVRFTNAVERTSGGFSRYLHNKGAYAVPGGRGDELDVEHDHKKELERAIRDAFSRGFDLQGLHFFDPFTPPHGVLENGEDGWLELPLAAIHAVAKDASVDRLPRVEMQIRMQDRYGEVALVLPSNTPLLHAEAESAPRPLRELEITQVLDTRNARSSEQREVTLELTAQGRGTIPELADLLVGFEGALPGFVLEKEVAIESRALAFPGEEIPVGLTTEPELPKPDHHLGVVLPRVERSWLLHYTPDGSAPGDRFTFPTLVTSVEGVLRSKVYGDRELEEVRAPSHPLVPGPNWRRYALMGAIATALLFVTVLLRLGWRARAQRTSAVAEQGRHIGRSPRATIRALCNLHRAAVQRADYSMQSALQRDIATLERDFFSRTPAAEQDGLNALSRIAAHWDMARSGARGKSELDIA